MMVIYNASDSPWVIMLMVIAQAAVPILQSGAGSDSTDNLRLAGLILMCISLYGFYRICLYGRTAYHIHQQHPAMPWREVVRASIDHHTARANAPRSQPTVDTEQVYNRIMHIIHAMPTEEYKTPEELKTTSIGDLKQRLKRRDVDSSNCVQRDDLVELLADYRGGPSNNDTCCICCDEYGSGDVLRVVRKCKHEFHLECLDRWAYTAAGSSRMPVCPLCNQELE